MFGFRKLDAYRCAVTFDTLKHAAIARESATCYPGRR
jgi:hypothetical protein